MIKKFLDSITPLRFAFFWALIIIAYMGWMICFLHKTSTKFICLAMPTLEEAARVKGLSNNMTNYYTYCVVGPNYPANQDHAKIKAAMEAQHPSGTLDSFVKAIYLTLKPRAGLSMTSKSSTTSGLSSLAIRSQRLAPKESKTCLSLSLLLRRLIMKPALGKLPTSDSLTANHFPFLPPA